MWPIAEAVILHNLKRAPILGMLAVAAYFIWSSVDPYTAGTDLQLGDLWPSRLALISTIVVVITVMLQELPKEMASKFHLILLAKPISRNDYLLGKVIGLFIVSVITITVLLMVAYASFFFQCSHEVPPGPNLFRPWMHYVMYLWVFSLVAGVLGAFMTEAYSILLVAFYLLGSYGVGILPSLKMSEGLPTGGGVLLSIFYYLVPNFQYFGPSHFEDYGFLAPFCVLVYAIGYTGIILPYALYRFERLSFQ